MKNEHFNQLLEKYKDITVTEAVIDEIGDGNINYVYRVQEQEKSIIIKEAKSLVRSSQRALGVNRLKIEHDSLKFFRQSTPELIPELHEYDAKNSWMVMEDLAGFITLREALSDSEELILTKAHMEKINDFFVKALISSTAFMMDYQEKRKLECEFNNPEMSDISERLVFTYPYTNHMSNNYRNETKSDVEALVSDKNFMNELLRLKYQFINHKESLIHGDLHSGSIFIKGKDIKILDSEFALFAPMAYDIGNVIAHLHISKIGKDNIYSEKIGGHIEYLMNLFKEKGISRLIERTVDQSVNEEFLENYITGVISDSFKYAGLEIIRRTIGTAKTAEFEIEDNSLKAEIEKEYVNLGRKLVLQ